jgi:fibronectin type 3 domain-containing protein
MKKLILPLLLLVGVFIAIASPGGGESDPPTSPQYSALWGESGELWDPATSRLKDFSNAGYMNGNVAIPDWPVGVDVTQPPFNAIPGDDQDDSAAFNAAIAACPPNHAVFVPNGRYFILQRVTLNRDYVVIRGESMFGSVLFFPKNTNEAYINEFGYDPDPNVRNTGVDPFFHVPGGTHRSIENLSFIFREQTKMGHWEHKGNDAISHSGTHSWLRNLYIRDADHAIATVGSNNLSVTNIIFDQSVNRNKVATESEGSVVGHMPINLNGTTNGLFHNILITGDWSHEFDEKNNSGNVISAVRSENGMVAYHGQGSADNLYTDLDVNTDYATGIGNSQNQNRETYWNIRSRSGRLSLDSIELPYNTDTEGNDHVFVGYDIDPAVRGDKVTSEFWYEAVEPEALVPQNIYLAQLAYRNKPVPPTPLLVAPNPHTGDVIRLEPAEDNSVSASNPDTTQAPGAFVMSVGNMSYFKFDLRGLNLSSIQRARLKLASPGVFNAPFGLELRSVTNDSWSENTLTFNNRPASVTALDSAQINNNSRVRMMEFDVTAFVQAEWAGDKVVTLNLVKVSGNGFLTSIHSAENGFGPELIIEQIPEAVPGAPSAPKDVRSYGMIGNIRLDWADNPESDVVAYNVYRSVVSADFSQYEFPIGMGLTTSDFFDIQENHLGGWDIGEVRDDIPHFYRVTAVDSHGRESESSLEIAGTAIGKNSTTQPPAFTNDPIVLPAAAQYLPYTASLAGTATDPEGDTLYYSKINGPDWLTILANGTISGTPRLGDTGPIQFQVQVSSLHGGRDEATVSLMVSAEAPNAPLFTDILPGDARISLDWSHASEGSAGYTFAVYRSTTPGGSYSHLITGLTATAHTDTGLVNGTAYYYVVTALNEAGESPFSSEAAATPVAGLSIVTNLIVTGGTVTNSAAWDAGLPVLGKDGRININGTVDTNLSLDGYSVLHTAGVIGQTGLSALPLINGTSWIVDGAGASTAGTFRGFSVRSASSFTLNQGTVNTASGRDWRLEDSGSAITINGGLLNLGRSLTVGGSAGASFTIKGGTIAGSLTSGDLGAGSLDDNAKTLNFNGGTTSVFRISLSGDNTLFNFGGTSAGSLTAGSIAGFGTNSKLNFMPGTRITLTLTGTDEWAAAQWAAGRLTYNGQNHTVLGNWAAVMTPNGLGGGYSFAYDSATETLSLAYTPPLTAAESWRLQYFGQTSNTGNAADNFDVEPDGLTNLMERAFGTHPINPTGSIDRPTGGIMEVNGNTYMTLTYRRLKGGSGTTGVNYTAGGITYTVEYDTDLINPWASGSVGAVRAPIDNGNGTETVTVRSPSPISAKAAEFMRLKLTSLP